MKIFLLSQLYGFSFGCKANADQRALGINLIWPTGQQVGPISQAMIKPGHHTMMKPPVKPSVCHFSELYNKDDYDGGCNREERRMNIVEDAVKNILNDFSHEVGAVLFPDIAEAQDNLKAYRPFLDNIREETQSAIHDIVLKYYSLVPKCVDFPDVEVKEAKSLELPYQFNNDDVIEGLFGPYMPSFGPRPFSSTPPLLGEVVLGEPILGEPISGEPILEEPILGEPILEEPILGEPALEEPILEEPISGEPILEEPILREPILEEPILGEPILEEPILEEPILGELFGPYMTSFIPRPFSPTPPLLREFVLGEPILGGPISGEPILGEPILGEPILGEPIWGEPILGDYISGEPVSGEPVWGAFSPIESPNDFMFNDFYTYEPRYELTLDDGSEELEAIYLNNVADNEPENFHEKKKFSKTKTSICEKLKFQTLDIVNRECKRPDIRKQCQSSCQVCYIGTN